MSEPPVDLNHLDHWYDKGILQSPCGTYLYINDWNCSLTFMVDGRVFVYLHDIVETFEWSLIECSEDGGYENVSGTPIEEITLSIVKEDWFLFNPPNITLVSEVPTELVDIVEYVKEYYL